MAFLCPSQLTVKKKALQGKAPLPDTYHVNGATERTTGEYKSALKSPSSSIDSNHKTEQRTVRIQEGSLTRESLFERKIRAATLDRPANIRVRVAHDFTTEDPEELAVRKGQFVKILYQQHDWIYVTDTSGNEGFIPYAYCSTRNISTDSKSSTSGYEESFEGSDELERVAERRKIDRGSKGHRTNKHRHKSNETPVTYFPKRPYGPKFTVLYDYKARYENDVSVERGEFVMLLNDQDPDWLWVAAEDGEEGFIPRTFVISHACEGCRNKLSKDATSSSSSLYFKGSILYTHDNSNHDNSPCSSGASPYSNHGNNTPPYSNGSVPYDIADNLFSSYNETLRNTISGSNNSGHNYLRKRDKTKRSSDINGSSRAKSGSSSGKAQRSRNNTPHGSTVNVHSSQTELVAGVSDAIEPCANKETSFNEEVTPCLRPESPSIFPDLTPYIPNTTPYSNNNHALGEHNDLDLSSSSSSIELDTKSRDDSSLTDATSSGSSDKKLELKGSKLISLYEYEGSAFDDLTVHAGEYVYANLKDQIVPKWIWAYSPYRKRSGFIPEAYLKEPVVTEI